MLWVFFSLFKIVVMVIISALILSSPIYAWSADGGPIYTTSDVKVLDPMPCPGTFSMISVSGEGSINACIMGESVRVASYASAQGGTMYAISFPNENIFYHLDLCTGIWGCVYSSENDTMVGFEGIYKNLVSKLTKTTVAGVVHYQLIDQQPSFVINKINNTSFQAQSLAISNNGKWVVYELKYYGFILVDVQKLEARRVVAPGVNYGLGNDPRVEMDVANDGATIAITGLRMGLSIISINDICGDRPKDTMERYFTGAVTACRYLHTPTESYIQQFLHALRPRFSDDNKSFSFDAFSNIVSAKHVTLFAEYTPEIASDRYLALGDSFTSGEGETDDSYYIGGATNRCHVSNRSYPFLLSAVWNLPVQSVACSGATIDSARSSTANNGQTAQLNELESINPQIATIGIGGNDAGLIGKLKDCIGLGTCRWAKTVKERSATALEIKNLFPKLVSFYKDAKVRTKGPVIVIGYPHIIYSGASCQSPIGLLLDETERTFMNESITYLNRVIRAATEQAGTVYADVEQAFSGEALCSSPESSVMNAIRIGGEYPDLSYLPFLKIIGSESFHPKPDGHAKLAAEITHQYRHYGNIDLLINSGVPTSVPTPTGYWDSGEAITKQQKSLPFIEKNSISITDTIKISVPAFSFKPFSMVSVELHSEVKPLGEYQVQGDGSLEISISGQQYQSGTHSVHLLGENYTGSSSDIYDFVDIHANESIAQNPNSNGTEQATDLDSSPISSLTPLEMTPNKFLLRKR
jgi:lysophospholipase L1-like esterase